MLLRALGSIPTLIVQMDSVSMYVVNIMYNLMTFWQIGNTISGQRKDAQRDEFELDGMPLDIVFNFNRGASTYRVNSLKPSGTYIRLSTETSLDQIMAPRLSGAKPLSEPMLTCSQFDSKEHTSMSFFILF